MPPRPLAPQLVVLLLAMILAAIGGAATFGGLLGAYAIAWAAVNVAVARGVALPRLERARTALLAVAIGVAPVVTLAGRWSAIPEAESLVGLDCIGGATLEIAGAALLALGLIGHPAADTAITVGPVQLRIGAAQADCGLTADLRF